MLVQLDLRIGDTPARVQAITPRADVRPALLRLDRQIRSLSRPWAASAVAGPDSAGVSRPGGRDRPHAYHRSRGTPAACSDELRCRAIRFGNERLDQEMSRMVASSQ